MRLRRPAQPVTLQSYSLLAAYSARHMSIAVRPNSREMEPIGTLPERNSILAELNLLAVRNTCSEQLQEIIDDVAALDELEAGGRNMLLGVTIEACAVGPFDPRLPDGGDDAAQGAPWANVLQEADDPTRFDHPAKFAKSRYLQSVW